MNLGAPEIILIILAIILLFGAKKLPDLARSVGRSMRIFKSEVKEMANDDDNPVPPQQGQLPPSQPSQSQPNYGQQGNPAGGDYGHTPQNYRGPNA